MIELNELANKVIVDLPNGVYNFTNLSGTGKTWLSNVIKQYESIDSRVISVTYNEILKYGEKTIKKLIKPGEQRLIILDRYDMYYNFDKDQLIKFGSSGIVLIDSKETVDFMDDAAVITIYKNKIVVD